MIRAHGYFRYISPVTCSRDATAHSKFRAMHIRRIRKLSSTSEILFADGRRSQFNGEYFSRRFNRHSALPPLVSSVKNAFAARKMRIDHTSASVIFDFSTTFLVEFKAWIIITKCFGEIVLTVCAVEYNQLINVIK